MNSASWRGSRALAAALILGAVVTAAYWIAWFLVPGGRALLASLPEDACYITFENAFPVADGWMALACAVAARGLLRDDARARPWLFVAGGAALYLAGMDILYDLENSVYPRLADPAVAGAVASEAAINLATVALGGWTLLWAWRHPAATHSGTF